MMPLIQNDGLGLAIIVFASVFFAEAAVFGAERQGPGPSSTVYFTDHRHEPSVSGHFFVCLFTISVMLNLFCGWKYSQYYVESKAKKQIVTDDKREDEETENRSSTGDSPMPMDPGGKMQESRDREMFYLDKAALEGKMKEAGFTLGSSRLTKQLMAEILVEVAQKR